MDQATKWMIRGACGVVFAGAAGVVLVVVGFIGSGNYAERAQHCKAVSNYDGYQRQGLISESWENMSKCMSKYGLKWRG